MMRKFTKIIKTVFEKDIEQSIQIDEKKVMQQIQKG